MCRPPRKVASKAWRCIWHGIYAPKGTPGEATASVQSLQVALKDPNVVARFAELGTAPSPEAHATPAALKAKLEGEISRWKPIIEAAGVYADCKPRPMQEGPLPCRARSGDPSFLRIGTSSRGRTPVKAPFPHSTR